MATSSLLASLQSWPSSRFSFRVNSPALIPESHPLVNVFESKLAEDLEQLSACDDARYLSARWLSRAMSVILSTHSSVEAFVADLPQASAEHGNICKWLDESLDDSVKLLDACNALRASVLDLKAYHTCARLALQSLEINRPVGEAHFRRAQLALSKAIDFLKKRDENPNKKGQRNSKLDRSASMLFRRTGEKISVEDSFRGHVLGALCATQTTTLFICGVLTMALSVKQRRSMSAIVIAGQSGWSISLSSLQQRLKEQIERKKTTGPTRIQYLEELENVDATLRRLHELLCQALRANKSPVRVEEYSEHMNQSLENLRKHSDDLEKGLAQLEHQIAELYQMLISSRMILLDIYPKSALTLKYYGI